MTRRALALTLGLLLGGAVGPVQAVHNASCLGEVFESMGFMEGQLHSTLPSRAEHCLGYAHGVPHEPEFIAALQQHSWPWPPPREPPLAAHDWDLGRLAQRPPAWPDLTAGSCNTYPQQELTRVKIYNGVLYAHYPHDDNSTLGRDMSRAAREAMYERLLLAMWLYKDMPDVDFAVSTDDVPLPCNLTFPVLQFAVVNKTSPSTGTTLDIDPRKYACHYGHNPEDCVGYTQGFTMPTSDVLWHLGLSPRQLWALSFCMHATYIVSEQSGHPPQACHVPRKPKVFWRGSSTGLMVGWSVRKADAFGKKYNDSSQAEWWLHEALQNKRVRLAVMAGVWPWMDVGITNFMPRHFPGGWQKENTHTISSLRNVISADYVAMDKANAYHLVVNLDGAGPAYRLTKLMLSNVPVIKVESILREWFIESAVPGVHYVPTRYDLSDIGHDTRVLLEEAQQDSSRLEKMAVAAAALAVDKANLLAQVKATAWSVARIKEVCQWEVLPPRDTVSMRPGADMSRAEAGWHVIRFKPRWSMEVPQAIKDSMVGQLHHNLMR